MSAAASGEVALVGDGLVADNILLLDSPGNRDGCYEPYVLLARLLREHGYLLHTPDRLGGAACLALHLNVQPLPDKTPCWLLQLETAAIHPANAEIPAGYRKVFTWNDALVDGERFIKINLPNPLVVPAVDGFACRPRFCCLIAGNKATRQYEPRELYSERVRAIRWFERHAPAEFDLYGTEWNFPRARSGRAGRLARRLWRQLSRVVTLRPFPSYRGKVERKRDVLLQTRFSICYENMRDMPGYITEKIFDSFFAGCVPVYWGANNVTDHIPADCFIDRRQFADTAAVYAHLKAMDEDVYRGYQQRIATFLASDAARQFGADAFAETIANAIVQELGRAA